jgi:two-component sensor histidine kinase
MKRLIGATAAALFFFTGYGQYVPGGKIVAPDKISGLLDRLSLNLSSNERAATLLDLGYGYLYKRGETPNDLDSGMVFSTQLTELAARTGNTFYKQEGLLLTVLLRMEQKDFAASEKLLLAMNDTTRQRALLSLAGFCSLAASLANPEERGMLDTAAHYAEAALSLAIKTRYYIKWTVVAVEIIANHYRARHLIPIAEKYYLLTLQCTDVNGYPSIAQVYSRLSIVYTTEGNFYKAMDYGIRAEKALTPKSTDADVAHVYNCLGGLNAVQERPEKVLFYYGKLLKEPLRYRDLLQFYGVVATYCANLQKLNRLHEVLPYMSKMQAVVPPTSNMDHYFANLALGRCYRELRDFAASEKCFLEGIKYAEAGRISTGAINYHLGLLYYQFDQFEKAVIVFKVAEKKMSVENSPLIAMNSLALAKAEAAFGNHENAYRSLLNSKRLSDSIFTVGKARLTDELETQYQTSKKEAELRSKEENIFVLNNNAERMEQEATIREAKLKEASLIGQRNEIALQLKAKEFEILQKNSLEQQAAIDQAKARKKLTFLIIGLLSAIVALLCWLFWSKLRSNKVISDKNSLLQQLVKDKSWLLKEMHHRVKNNLHTIVSLLETQSIYLQDDALQAIQHSQSRIFSMSLIHQQLYQSDDCKTIDMATYVPELVGSLKESFSLYRTFQMQLDIDSMAFNVDEAVCLGLIINEAVTNSMKYAFDAGQRGEIYIRLKATRYDEFELVLADNGRGLQKDFDHEKTGSLGFQLIRGLSEQLQASLAIVNDNGLKIIVSGISAYRTNRVKEMENELKQHWAM